MISISNLNKSFGDRAIFKNLNIEIKDGEFAVVSGVSGKGKTTLLNMIGGLETPDSGSINVDDYDVTGRINRRKYWGEKIGFLFQNFALIDDKTVMQNLNVVGKKYRTGISFDKALKMVGMEGSEKRKIYTLSGGEQQRIALARLLVKKCDIILADEPTGSLDIGNRDMVISILRELEDMGKTIVMVTHDEGLIKEGTKVIEL